ncbi:MAG: formate/nitrite transporter family protein [Gemmatimonadota bacterium]|nr:formate/nitrite transporter family protein [Gemmatimonadota bacterium]
MATTKPVPSDEERAPKHHDPENPYHRGGAVDRPKAGTRFSATEIHDNVFGSAEDEAKRPARSLLWSALAAGLVIGFSFLATGFAAYVVPEPEHLRRFAIAVAYPTGFIFVVMGRSELFTENTLRPVVPLLHYRDRLRLRLLGRMWGLLLLGNMVGAFIFAWIFARTEAINPVLRPSLDAVAAEAARGTFGEVFYLAIFAGWLIALLAWLLASTHNTMAQIAIIWLTTAGIGAFGFKHSIVGAVEAFYRALTGGAAWGDMIGNFIVPSLLGNAIGGVVLVALLNYAQVQEETEER